MCSGRVLTVLKASWLAFPIGQPYLDSNKETRQTGAKPNGVHLGGAPVWLGEKFTTNACATGPVKTRTGEIPR